MGTWSLGTVPLSSVSSLRWTLGEDILHFRHRTLVPDLSRVIQVVLTYTGFSSPMVYAISPEELTLIVCS